MGEGGRGGEGRGDSQTMDPLGVSLHGIGREGGEGRGDETRQSDYGSPRCESPWEREGGRGGEGLQ